MEFPHSKYYFNDFDTQTLKRPLDDEAYSYVVCDLVERLWSRLCYGLGPRYGRRDISDTDFHTLFIYARQSRYKFPDYLDIVGPPASEHYDDTGELTTQRKATLLLIGLFDWNGMKIGKHQAKYGFNPIDDSYEDSRYTREQKGWYVPIARNRPEAKTLTVRDYFSPLRNFRCQRLEQYLTANRKFSKVTLRDKNPFNCHPDNLEIVSTRGRPKKCNSCERRVTDRTSKRIKVSGTTMRYCLNCLAELGRRGADEKGRIQ